MAVTRCFSAADSYVIKAPVMAGTCAAGAILFLVLFLGIRYSIVTKPVVNKWELRDKAWYYMKKRKGSQKLGVPGT